MSISALAWCLKKELPNPTTKLVLMILCNYANESHQSYPSEKHLGELVGVSDRSIRRSLKQLSDLGFIKIEARIGTSNLYTVNIGMDTSDHTPRTSTTIYTKEDTKVINKVSKDKYDQDFKDFWDAYPRNINKHLAHQKWKVAIKNFPIKKLLVCTIRFANDVKINKTEEQFIPHPSTWLNQKRYLDYENQTTQTKKKSLNNLAG